MLSKLASKFLSVAQGLSFKEKVDVCVVSVVVGVSTYCGYKVGIDYYDLAMPEDIEKQN